MDQPAHPHVDGDLEKGAVERAPDGANAPPRDEQGRSEQAIEITKDVVNADPEDLARAEDELGADENGTPG